MLRGILDEAFGAILGAILWTLLVGIVVGAVVIWALAYLNACWLASILPNISCACA